MYVYMHAYIYMYAYMYMHAYKHTHIHVHVSGHAHTCVGITRIYLEKFKVQKGDFRPFKWQPFPKFKVV